MYVPYMLRYMRKYRVAVWKFCSVYIGSNLPKYTLWIRLTDTALFEYQKSIVGHDIGEIQQQQRKLTKTWTFSSESDVFQTYFKQALQVFKIRLFTRQLYCRSSESMIGVALQLV